MRITSVSPLVTLDSLKAWLGLEDVEDTVDTNLTTAIAAASLAVANYIGTDPNSAARTETRDGDDRTIIFPAMFPVTAVSSVTVNGVSIPASSGWNSSGFGFDATKIFLRGYTFERGVGNVILAYTSGWSTMPTQITQAVMYAASGFYNSSTVDPNVTGESVPGVYSATYAQAYSAGGTGPAAGSLPTNARVLLDPFRRMYSAP